MKYLLLIFFITVHAHAVEVAFLEVHDQHGRPIQLEPGGRFMHVAIRYGKHWLHAHSRGGVELIDDFKGIGDKVIILDNPRMPEPTLQDFEFWLGKPFDYKYIWENPQATYCTRLVAELLGVEPSAMSFDASAWRLHRYRAIGELGLSPDDLYQILLERGFEPECERRLEKAI